MYAPPAFRWNNRAAALEFARQHNFATLITVADGAPLVTHAPLMVDAGRRLIRGHLARANPHAAFLDGRDHVAVFTGPHGYLSPDWYGAEKPDVPTWNYMAVHVAGCGRVLANDGDVRRLLVDMSTQEERRRTDLAADGEIWTVDKVPADALARMRRAVVAFEIEIAHVEAKAKLSQNKPEHVIDRVCEALASTGDQNDVALAKQMRAFKISS